MHACVRCFVAICMLPSVADHDAPLMDGSSVAGLSQSAVAGGGAWWPCTPAFPVGRLVLTACMQRSTDRSADSEAGRDTHLGDVTAMTTRTDRRRLCGRD
jgi:hypothetical protein